MKQEKKLTREQSKIVSSCGLNAEEWACTLEDKFYLHIRDRTTGEVAIIDKKKGETISHGN